MPHNYKFFYFPGRGRGEHIRQLLKLAGAQFEEVVVTQETWPGLKDEMPLGQVPVLEIDGKKIGQSLAIARFVGHEFGLAGKDNVENARLDMIADLIQDASNSDGIKEWPLVKLGMKKVDNEKEYFKQQVRPQMENYAATFEKFLVENGGNSLLSGDNVTWVDVLAAEFFSKFVDYGEKDALEAFPHIQNLIDRIHNIPVIKKHIENRAKTPI
ncbi:CRE-GST-36 protein [Aphelenchoides avenae]|nr:CRE-GST-36 protein [Aphelenchus avenae]